MNHNINKIIDNVLIRPLSIEDIENIRKWRNTPENTVFLSKIPYITKEMQLEWYKKYIENPNEYMFAIEEIEELNRVVGSLSLYNFETDEVEVGKILVGDPEAHGKGIGTNAFIAAVKVAFEVFHIKQVILHVYAENISAVKSYTRAGFEIVNTRIFNGQEEYIMMIKNKEEYV